MKLKYLITGTGRCGTVFYARFLTSIGVLCGHESVFDWRGLSHAIKVMKNQECPELSHASAMSLIDGKWVSEGNWVDVNRIEAESSYLAAPFLKEDCLKDVPVIHIVRNPVKVVNSFCNYIDYFKSDKEGDLYEKFIYERFPELKSSMSNFDRAALYVVRWNQMIESSSPDLFHRIEDGPEKILNFIGGKEDAYRNNKINTYEKPVEYPFDVSKLEDKSIKKEFIDMGRRYGYKMHKDLVI